ATGRAAPRVAKVERNLRIAEAVRGVAAAVGATPSQVAIAWARQRPGVVIPILGARHTAQLEDNLGALDVRLDDAHRAALDAASAIELGFPHDFLGLPSTKEMIFGGVEVRRET